MRRLCSLLSGGKDSNYALYKALREGYEPACILVVESGRDDSWMFHTPYTRLALLQAEAMGLLDKVVTARVSGIKEKEVEELAKIMEGEYERSGFDTIVVGALASRYQYERISRIARKLGVEVYAPAWMRDPVSYMRGLISEGIKFIIIKISVMGLPMKILGLPVEKETLEKILALSKKYGFHPAFEGGEAETLVYDAPHYKRRLCIEATRKKLGMYEYMLDIRHAYLDSKNKACLQVDGERVG